MHNQSCQQGFKPSENTFQEPFLVNVIGGNSEFPTSDLLVLSQSDVI